ncbi:MAG TPA: ABC transporter permease [Candidatus Polarisedimenticolia bacterium]|nr:ABC transporter permease [Candidatus Polarisedimenticolia bacterium]
MRDLEYVPAAISALSRHKLRTLLTMLGIIFGVGAVISMLSIGAGAQAEAMKVIDSMGLRNIIIREKPSDEQALFTIRERSLGLSLRDVEGLDDVAADIVAHSARKRVRVDRTLSASGRSEGQVLGVSRPYFELMNLRLAEGTLFDPAEEGTYQRVCVLGHRARQDLFAFLDPIGQSVKVNDVWFTVVGVLQPRNLGKESFQGVEIESGDNSIFIPITTALKMFDRPRLTSELDEIVLQVAHGASVESSSLLVSNVLKQLHGGEADFTVVVPEELLAQSRRTRRIFNIVMGGIAGISLLVGGIGIMNIMLASVMERTREIGVRRAIGATRHDILRQFLTEAILISLLGGLSGVILGFSIAWGVSIFSEWKTVVTTASIVLSFGFSGAVGLIFGTYPALNAARLDPIEALRHE